MQTATFMKTDADGSPDSAMLGQQPPHGKCAQRWLGEFEQRAGWNVCLKTAKMAVNRRDDEQETAPEP